MQDQPAVHRHRARVPRPPGCVRLALLVVVLLGLELPACTASRTGAGPLGLGAEVPASATLEVQTAYPFLGRSGGQPLEFEHADADAGAASWFEIVEGAHAGRLLHQVRRPGAAEPASGGAGVGSPALKEFWTISRAIEGESAPLEERRLGLDQRGSLLLLGETNHDRGVLVQMNPPPMTMPHELRLGEAVTQKVELRLPLIKRPEKLRDRGTGVMDLTYSGAQRISVLGREVVAQRVREVFTSDLSSAKAVRTTESWFAPGFGLVAERYEEEVKVLGLTIERTSRAIRLVAPPG